MCEDAGFDAQLSETVYWVALLRYIGCTGHAHEVATLFGDEIAIRGPIQPSRSVKRSAFAA